MTEPAKRGRKPKSTETVQAVADPTPEAPKPKTKKTKAEPKAEPKLDVKADAKADAEKVKRGTVGLEFKAPTLAVTAGKTTFSCEIVKLQSDVATVEKFKTNGYGDLEFSSPTKGSPVAITINEDGSLYIEWKSVTFQTGALTGAAKAVLLNLLA